MNEPKADDRLRAWKAARVAINEGLDALRELVPEADTWEDIKPLLEDAITFGFEKGWTAGLRDAQERLGERGTP